MQRRFSFCTKFEKSNDINAVQDIKFKEIAVGLVRIILKDSDAAYLICNIYSFRRQNQN